MNKLNDKVTPTIKNSHLAQVGNGKAERRSYDLYQVGGYIHQITRSIYKQKSPVFYRLVHDWIDIVGHHYGELTVPKKLYNGILTLSCSNIIATEIQYITPAFIQKINLYCGQPLVKKLRFLYSQQGASFSQSGTDIPNLNVKPVEVNNLPSEGLKKALGLMGGHILNKNKGT